MCPLTGPDHGLLQRSTPHLTNDHTPTTAPISEGDRNHARFYLLLVVEAVLLLWMEFHVVQLWARCYLLRPPLMRLVGAWQGRPQAPLLAQLPCPGVQGTLGLGMACALGIFGAVWLALVVYLLLLHSYLAATGQTTLELLKVRERQAGQARSHVVG